MARIIALVFRILSACGAVWILGLVLLISADVAGRYLFSRPVEGVPEIVSLSIVGIVFLQMPEALRSGRFVRSDMLISRLQERAPRAARVLEIIQMALGAALLAVLVHATYPRLIDAWTYWEMAGDFGSIMIPTAPIFFLIVAGAALTALQYAISAISLITRLGSETAKATGESDDL